MINPFAAGGRTTCWRGCSRNAWVRFWAAIVLENIGGAGGMKRRRPRRKSAPTVYTFLLGTVGTQAQNQTCSRSPPTFQPPIRPVALMVEAPLVLVARNDLPPRT